jgi:hypothetical protein
LPVPGFAPLAGIPERTYRRRLARLRSGDVAAKGTWPSPAIDAVEAVAKYAADWPTWGHRKIAAMMRADGHVVSTSTVERALRRRGLLPPHGFRADRKTWAVLRRKVFRDPPTERNRVWQTDFRQMGARHGNGPGRRIRRGRSGRYHCSSGPCWPVMTREDPGERAVARTFTTQQAADLPRYDQDALTRSRCSVQVPRVPLSHSHQVRGHSWFRDHARRQQTAQLRCGN